MENYKWNGVYDTKKLEAGTVVLFQYGVGTKEAVEVCHLIITSGELQVLASEAGWARKLSLFTRSGTLMNSYGNVSGRLIRQMKIKVPKWVKTELG